MTSANEQTPILGEVPRSYTLRLNIPSDVEQVMPVYSHGVTGQEEIENYVCIDKKIDPESMLNQAIEGFEYDMTQNDIFIKEKEQVGLRSFSVEVLRYMVLFGIGMFTGIAAFLIDISIDILSKYKFKAVGKLIEEMRDGPILTVPGFLWGTINAALVTVSALMVVFLAPVAAGSGIPQIKCYLNGINVPFVMRGLTLFVKGIGVVLSVAGGLAVGKEGPMIHSGAAIAAGLSQGRFTWFKRSFQLFRPFRNDQEKRDFVSAGAAAGVAAAFGAPVGGLLFSLEEGASFVNQRLTWNILFSSMTSMFTLAFFSSVYNGKPFVFTPGGLASFGTFDPETLNKYTVQELAMFCIIGAAGGLLGAFFNKLNLTISKFRKAHVNSKATRVIEAAFAAFGTAAIGFTLMTYHKDCQPLGTDPLEFPLQMFCSDSEYNAVGSLFFQTPEKSVRSLFHDATGTYQPATLIIFSIIYFFLACFTFGLSVSSGLFIPSLLCGAAWGRTVGIYLNKWLPLSFPDPGKFALIGAAAQLGGACRMTVSLTVILMEATGNVLVGLPLLVTLVVAKYTGDFFNEGIYDLHIELSGFALLPWQPDKLSVTKKAFQIMSSPVVYLTRDMKVSELVARVSKDPHHAYPVVEGDIDCGNHRYGCLLGLISREHLALLLKKKIFEDDDGVPGKVLEYKDYDEAYPRFPSLMDAFNDMTPEDHNRVINLDPYLHRAPYVVSEFMTMNRVYSLFRLLGLRHLPVVDYENQLRGMITRKDLRRFRFEHTKDGRVLVEELVFSRQI